MNTYMAKPSTIRRDWYVIDATDKPLGRLASAVARRLRGKHKPDFTPHMDVGDYVVIINARHIAASGRKRTDKFYYHHTGYPGGIKSSSLEEMLVKHPCRVIELAVKGMMPKGPLGRQMLKKLKVYAGSEHEHQAQQPTLIEAV